MFPFTPDFFPTKIIPLTTANGFFKKITQLWNLFYVSGTSGMYNIAKKNPWYF